MTLIWRESLSILQDYSQPMTEHHGGRGAGCACPERDSPVGNRGLGTPHCRPRLRTALQSEATLSSTPPSRCPFQEADQHCGRKPLPAHSQRLPFILYRDCPPHLSGTSNLILLCLFASASSLLASLANGFSEDAKRHTGVGESSSFLPVTITSWF